jgi:dCMP deaminase
MMETPRAQSPAADPLAALEEVITSWEGRPSWDEYFMGAALLISSRSACGRLHVGCVLVSAGDRRNRIIAAGYNGFLPGLPHDSRVRDGHELATVHAEQNAVTDAARRGVSVEGATAYLTHFPCIHCAKILAASGIGEIVWRHDYRNDPLARELLEAAGIRLRQMGAELRSSEV